MRQLEHDYYQKIKQAFPIEIDLLEKGINALVKCDMLLQQTLPLLGKPGLRNNLLKATQQDRCHTTHYILVQHSITFLKAARLLLLTGYIAPSLSCLRTAFESFQNAHICSVSDGQAINLLKGKHLNKKLDINYPIQLDETVGKEIKRTLANYGVHANYQAIETQALYDGSIFVEENRATYEFILLRNVYSFLMIILLLLDYLLDKRTFLKKELPDAMSLAKDIGRTVQEIGVKLAKLAR